MQPVIKPHNLLLIAAVLFFISCFLTTIETTDINFSDTYYVINFSHLLRMITILFLLFSAFYKFLQNYLIYKSLNWFHIVCSIILILTIFWTNYNFNKSLALIETTQNGSIEYYSQNALFVKRLILMLIILQIIPIINLVIGLIKKKSNSKK